MGCGGTPAGIGTGTGGGPRVYAGAHFVLDASDETLRTRKEGDTARTRGFFEHYRNQLLPLKREWFRNREDTTFLQTDGLTAEQEGEAVLRWCTQWIGMNR